MNESLENTISEGFHTWTRNLNVCIPLIINFISRAFILIFSLILVMFILKGDLNSNDITAMTDEEFLVFMSFSFIENISSIVLLIISVLIIMSLFDAYFQSGTVGMSQNATSRGDTDMADMFKAGNRNFIHVFTATVIITLIKMGGIIFLVPGAVLTRNYIDFVDSSQLAGGILLLSIGLLIWAIYLLVLDVIFSPVIYAIVIDRLDAINGILEGYYFFMHNKINVFLVWLLVLVASITMVGLFKLIGYFLALLAPGGLNVMWSLISELIFLVTLQSMIRIWWTRLYMVNTGKPIHDNVLLAHP